MSEETEKVRVSKLLSQQGLCSRREADVFIERGWVLVDGEPVTELGTRAYPHQKITLTKSAQTKQDASVTILMHKPIGIVSGQPEPGYKPALSLVTAEAHFKGDRSPQRFHPMQVKGLAPAGRLDIDSTGLLILTQDGRVAKQLIGENSPIEKEYLVRIIGTLTPDALAKLNFGLSLDGKALKRAQVSWLNKEQLRFILREGKKRQIRRMCELVGVRVAGLKRVRIGKVMLGDLPLGQWRYLRDDEKF
jgi:23S rRNA pseudouridine2604 synthase